MARLVVLTAGAGVDMCLVCYFTIASWFRVNRDRTKKHKCSRIPYARPVQAGSRQRRTFSMSTTTGMCRAHCLTCATFDQQRLTFKVHRIVYPQL